MNILIREQPRVFAYGLALRAGLLIYACMLHGGPLHGPTIYVVTTFSRTLTLCPPAHAHATSEHVSGPRSIYGKTYSLSRGSSMMKYCSADGADECAHSSFEVVASCY